MRILDSPDLHAGRLAPVLREYDCLPRAQVREEGLLRILQHHRVADHFLVIAGEQLVHDFRRRVLQDIFRQLVRNLVDDDQGFPVLADLCQHVREDADGILLALAVSRLDFRKQPVGFFDARDMAELLVFAVFELHGLREPPHDERHDERFVLRRFQLFHLEDDMLM